MFLWLCTYLCAMLVKAKWMPSGFSPDYYSFVFAVKLDHHGHLHELLVGGGAGAGVTFKGRATWSFTAVLVSTAEVKAVKTRLTSHVHIFMG